MNISWKDEPVSVMALIQAIFGLAFAVLAWAHVDVPQEIVGGTWSVVSIAAALILRPSVTPNAHVDRQINRAVGQQLRRVPVKPPEDQAD